MTASALAALLGGADRDEWASYFLGVCYRYGLGFPIDKAASHRCWENAALGLARRVQSPRMRPTRLLRVGASPAGRVVLAQARVGSPDAQFLLHLYYRDVEMVLTNLAEDEIVEAYAGRLGRASLRWLRRAAASGSAEAQERLDNAQALVSELLSGSRAADRELR